MGSIRVTELGKDAGPWQEYVRQSPKASFYHTIEWRDVIQRAFAHQPRYLIAEEDRRPCGVLPLVEMNSVLFGHFFVSLPFLNYGGVVADTLDAERALARAAVELACRLRASHIELRQSRPTAEPLDEGWGVRQHKAALVIRLACDPGRHWDGISSRLRGKVRKAEKSETTFTVCGKEALADFYWLYARNMRDLGTPVYGRTFFENVLERSGQRVDILLARRRQRPAAAAIAVGRGGRIELPWICQNYAESAFYVNEFLYWKAIEWACAHGAAELDLGRSTVGAGPYRFKLQWNPEIQGLHWYYWTAPGVAAPQLNPDNPKYALAIRCWKKLPLAVANRIGPWIVRNIP